MVEPPTPSAYLEIFKRAAYTRGIKVDEASLDHVLNNYMRERRQMKACEPRDLLDRMSDICLFEGRAPEVSVRLIDAAWRNYFGTSHGFGSQEAARKTTGELLDANPLQI